MSAPLMEVCVDSVESALSAVKGGASRLELCSALSEGGLTPSPGTLKVIKQQVDVPVFVMLRPRAGLDYHFSALEIEALTVDAAILKAHGADGFVFGALTNDKRVDLDACAAIVKATAPLPLTFHRAIDESRNLNESLEAAIALGFRRVLTSGGESSAALGLAAIRGLVEKAEGRLVVMPGAGINTGNLREILALSKAREFHGSAKVQRDSLTVTSAELVREMVEVAKEFVS